MRSCGLRIRLHARQHSTQRRGATRNRLEEDLVETSGLGCFFTGRTPGTTPPPAPWPCARAPLVCRRAQVLDPAVGGMSL